MSKTYAFPPQQQWCGQTQPHAAHIWVNASNLYAACAGHLGEQS